MLEHSHLKTGFINESRIAHEMRQFGPWHGKSKERAQISKYVRWLI